MAVKSANAGPFTIPTAPSVGTTVAQNASANTFTAAYVQATASTSAALFITGVTVSLASTSKPLYCNVQIATGGSGSETVVGQVQFGGFSTAGATGQQIGATIPIWPPIPVANATRIALKTASDVASALSWAVSLQCVAQANVVAEGSIKETVDVQTWLGGTIPAVNVTGVPKVDVFDWLGSGAAAMTGDAFARLGAPVGASVSADVAAVKALLPRR